MTSCASPEKARLRIGGLFHINRPRHRWCRRRFFLSEASSSSDQPEANKIFVDRYALQQIDFSVAAADATPHTTFRRGRQQEETLSRRSEQ